MSTERLRSVLWNLLAHIERIEYRDKAGLRLARGVPHVEDAYNALAATQGVDFDKSPNPTDAAVHGRYFYERGFAAGIEAAAKYMEATRSRSDISMSEGDYHANAIRMIYAEENKEL